MNNNNYYGKYICITFLNPMLDMYVDNNNYWDKLCIQKINLKQVDSSLSKNQALIS